MSSHDDFVCEYCGNLYTVDREKWCKPCQMDNLRHNFENWTSGNEKIDEFIQEKQLKFSTHDSVVEWIPYNQFNNIKEIGKDDFATIYSAIWIDGPLYYNEKKWKRGFNRKATLKFVYNSQNNVNEFLNEAKLYRYSKPFIYGITQNPDTKDYIIVFPDYYTCKYCGKICDKSFQKPCRPCHLKNNFTNWTRSGNEIIDDSIQEMQLLKCNRYGYDRYTMFEWVPYNQFNDIKQIGKDDTITLYSAIWMDGPLVYNHRNEKNKRIPNKTVSLKCLNNSQNITNEFLNEVKSYINGDDIVIDDEILEIYGITQNPDTKNYIMVFEDGYCDHCGKKYMDKWYKWCEPCQINNLKQNFANWTSGNEKIDEFIQEIQLNQKHLFFHQYLFEWIPYNQFNNINEIIKDNFTTLYSAMWVSGPLNYYEKKKWERVPNKEVTLKFYNSHNITTNEFLNEIKSYLNGLIYGITQNPNSNDYIMVLFEDDYCKNCGEIYQYQYWCKICQVNKLKENFINWTSGNEKIDNIIQEMQLKINDYNDIIFEWIPYNQFNYIKEIGKGGFATVYSAIWMDGPLRYDYDKMKYERSPNKQVALKCLHNSHNITNEFLNEVKKYSINNDNILQIYGISQNPDTKGYIMIVEYSNGGKLDDYISNHVVNWDWLNRLGALREIISGLKKIHENKMVHRDFHIGNILSQFDGYITNTLAPISKICISDMGLCGEVSNIDEKNIYGVMPFVAPEVLKSKRYTQAADIYSFGMIMYFIMTSKQPFADCAHDSILAIKICSGTRPDINELEAPKCYIDLMKRCWDSNPDNRPNAIEIEKLIVLYFNDKEIIKQFEKADEYIKANSSSIKRNQLTTHPQACYTSQLLNPFTKDLSKIDDAYSISVEVSDFTKGLIENEE
ncbi:unnamed protein product [Rhizophagus irregularis]|nr:unnamed protein product [Rhizophagus irregularis]